LLLLELAKILTRELAGTVNKRFSTALTSLAVVSYMKILVTFIVKLLS